MFSYRRETAFLLVGDIIVFFISLYLALFVRNLESPTFGYFLEHVTAFFGIFFISLLIFFISGLYEKQTRLVKSILGIRILGAQIANTTIAAVLFFILPFAIAPKTVLFLYLVISVLLISLWRFFATPYIFLSETRTALLIAEGKEAEELYTVVEGNPKYFVQFAEQIHPNSLTEGMLATLVGNAVAQGVSLIVIDSRDPVVHRELPTLYPYMLSGVTFEEFATFYESLFDRVPVQAIDHAWLLEHLPRKNIAYAFGKRSLDLIGASIGGILALPIVAIAWLLITLTSSGNAFIFHARVGKGGKTFHIIKLRTMKIDDHGDEVLRAQNYVTRLGKFLRKTRIDELPQLINILQGTLSFIGPRPELPRIAEVYEKEIPYYNVRHLIVPGLSGWAQIYDYDAPRGAADVERTKRKLSFDLYYIKHRSFGLDIAISLKTLRALSALSGV